MKPRQMEIASGKAQNATVCNREDRPLCQRATDTKHLSDPRHSNQYLLNCTLKIGLHRLMIKHCLQ